MPDPYSAPKRYPHLYSSNLAAGARAWFPCVDHPHVKCPWIIELTFPRTLATAMPNFSSSFDTYDRMDLIGIASGDLIDHVVHPTNPRKKICVYSLKTPVSASSIMFAIGPFECLDVPGWGTSSQPGNQSHSSAANDASVPDSDHQPTTGSGREVGRNSEGRFYGGGRTFVLPGRRSGAEHTISFLNQVCLIWTSKAF
jgi:hypothetical protein